MKRISNSTLTFSVLVALLFAVKWFACSLWVSQLPAVTPVSLSLAFRPFWRIWPVVIPLAVFAAVLAAIAYSLSRSTPSDRRDVFVFFLAIALLPGVGEFALIVATPFLLGRLLIAKNGGYT